MSTKAAVRWRLLSPAGRAGPVAMIEISADTPDAMNRAFDALRIEPVPVGGLRLSNLLGVDSGIVGRFSDLSLVMMPHGGGQVLRAMCSELEARGISAGAQMNALSIYPEAADAVEAEALKAIATAASPLAIGLLLDQSRRWKQGGAENDPARDRVLNRLLDPPLIVAFGASNIGKSTLVNALAGRSVSIVADEPGTTRDHVGVRIDLAGLVARWVDTPGLRSDASDMERRAGEIAAGLAREADMIVLCGDRDHDPPDWSRAGSGAEVVRLVLRADLGSVAFEHDAMVSARSGEGIAALVESLRDRLVPPRFLANPGPWKFWDDGESAGFPS